MFNRLLLDVYIIQNRRFFYQNLYPLIYQSTVKNYTKLGDISVPNPVNTNDVRAYKLQLKLAQPVKARYVKLTADTGGRWVFIDEVEVRN